ncbi:PiggyBac transposable element-derived protein 4 [Acropora cervicornis]|uniref:PiggyBac transposable element-derived protein 4 n=1 Tax=Acropora cervicornis TaxID=6130 RepID=A0AAD9Q0N7_ACRCE|nr:PiggyBac transposable element-derived protein 4 [Acropora cervicornis]
MGGVDKNDQMKSYYTIPVSGKKWWSRILFNLVDRITQPCKRTLKSFRIDLATQLIGDLSSRRKRGRPSDEPLSLRNVKRHFPEYLPTNESGKRKERKCKVCFHAGVRKMTSYFCPDCNVGLCTAPCFRTYHQ